MEHEPSDAYHVLHYLMVDYIKKVCEKYHIDTTLLTKKYDRIKVLQLIPNLQMTDISPPPMTSPKLYGFHQLSYDDDIECYLSTFERLCISQKIPSDHWAVTFEAYLTGKAQKTFHLLTDADKQCFVAIKKAILFTYKLTPEAYCEKFRSAYKQSSETFHDFANRLRLYLRR